MKVNKQYLDKQITKYTKLLDQKLDEQKYQDFIEKNTRFAPRAFIQNHGIHFDLLLRKLKMSNDLISDFVMLSKSSITWNYIIIEIEKPQSKFFKDGTHNLHPDFITGCQQIKRWQAWFDQPENKLHFENQLLPLKKPIKDTKVNIKYVLVFGRRKEFKNSKEKMSLIHAQESEDFKIMSFDGLAENITHHDELYLAVRKAGAIEIKTKKCLSMTPFEWCDESDFILNKKLKIDILKNIGNEVRLIKKGSPLAKFRKEKKVELKEKIKRMKAVNPA